MKKLLISLGLTSMALAGCTSTDVVDEGIQSNAIGFVNVVNNQSRAVSGDLNAVNFDLFSVYGYYTKDQMEAHPVQIFDGDIVRKNTTDGVTSWSYDNTRYWVPDAKYFFYAYSCGDVALSTSYGTIQLDLTTTTREDRALEINNFKCDATHQHDLICASNEGYVGKDPTKGVANQNVKFQFKHVLSKINTIFTSEFPAGYDVVVSNVRLVNFYDEADFDFADMTWKDHSRTADDKALSLTIPNNANIAAVANGENPATSVTSGSVFVIPRQYQTANIELHFTIEVKQGNDVFLSRNLKGTWQPNWQPGYFYTYRIKIGGNTAQLEPIVFESTQDMSTSESWGGTETVDMTFSLQ